jgi:hypothetical protein
MTWSDINKKPTEDGVEVRSPNALFTDWRPFYPFVVITTTGFLDVKKQLEDMQRKEGRDFCVSPVLKDFSILDRIANHRAKILFTCSDPYNEKDKRGGLYIMHIPGGRFRQLHGGHCHGLAKMPERSVVLVNDTAGGIEIRHPRVVGGGVTARSGSLIRLPEDARPHGVACEGDWIAICYSGRDEIAFFRKEALGLQPSEVDQLSNKFFLSGLPAHHINDCAIHDGSVYASMFSWSGNWKKGIFDGVIAERGLPSDDWQSTNSEWRIVLHGLSLPHTKA